MMIKLAPTLGGLKSTWGIKWISVQPGPDLAYVLSDKILLYFEFLQSTKDALCSTLLPHPSLVGVLVSFRY